MIRQELNKLRERVKGKDKEAAEKTSPMIEVKPGKSHDDSDDDDDDVLVERMPPSEVEGGSAHQFIADFFRTDIMNHCEFLKHLNNFGDDDAYLIIEMCERLVQQTKGKDVKSIEPFYGGDDDALRASDVGHIPRDDFQKHKSFPRNCFNIMMVYTAITKLDGHEYNVYELAYLNYHSKMPFRVALLIFAIQAILLWIVLYANLLEYEVAIQQRDAYVIVVDVCTTVFFTTFCFGQYDRSRTFTTAARGVIGNYLVEGDDLQIRIQNPIKRGKWEPELMLFLNELVNQKALMMAPLFNFYFILLSSTAMDAVLNGFSLLFIFELDDYILPLFSGVDIEDKLVINAHDFIMVQPKTEELSCRRKGPEIPRDARVYVSLQKRKHAINVYSRVRSTKYNKTTYILDGVDAGRFLNLCDESLQCLQNFKDIHD